MLFDTSKTRLARNLSAMALCASALLGAAQPVQAMSFPSTTSGMQCPDAGFWNELIGGVCWSSVFPIMVAGSTMINRNNLAPANAYSGNPICKCAGDLKRAELPRVGVPIGYWQPSLMIETVSHPFCMPVLGGLYAGGAGLNGVLFSGGVGGGGASYTGAHPNASGFWNVHQWTYPLVSMLNLLNVPNCGTGYNGMNLLDLSEVQPQWNDDLTAELLWPESSVLSGPVGTFGAVGECTAQMPPTKSQPIDSMYWTAGCWGLLFPPDGIVSDTTDTIRASSLVAARFLSTEYRLGNGVSTMGAATLCGPQYTAVLPKEQYRWQMIFPNNEGTSVPNATPVSASDPTTTQPVPDSIPQQNMITSDNVNTSLSPVQINSALQQVTNGNTCTHWTGQSPLTWGEWLGQPGTGSNFVYLVFQWTDCCLGIIGGNLSGQ
jgi:conjugal transfer pilus assembly protein TraU